MKYKKEIFLMVAIFFCNNIGAMGFGEQLSMRCAGNNDSVGVQLKIYPNLSRGWWVGDCTTFFIPVNKNCSIAALLDSFKNADGLMKLYDPNNFRLSKDNRDLKSYSPLKENDNRPLSYWVEVGKKITFEVHADVESNKSVKICLDIYKNSFSLCPLYGVSHTYSREQKVGTALLQLLREKPDEISINSNALTLSFFSKTSRNNDFFSNLDRPLKDFMEPGNILYLIAYAQ